MIVIFSRSDFTHNPYNKLLLIYKPLISRLSGSITITANTNLVITSFHSNSLNLNKTFSLLEDNPSLQVGYCNILSINTQTRPFLLQHTIQINIEITNQPRQCQLMLTNTIFDCEFNVNLEQPIFNSRSYNTGDRLPTKYDSQVSDYTQRDNQWCHPLTLRLIGIQRQNGFHKISMNSSFKLANKRAD